MWAVPVQNHIFSSHNLHLAGGCSVLGLDGLHVLSGCISSHVGSGTKNTADKYRNGPVKHEIDINFLKSSFEKYDSFVMNLS
jgi:hypothetical protein